MKIAFIGGFAFSPKGTMRARAFPLAVELARLGHNVTMFLTPYDNPSDLGREWEQEWVHIRNMNCGPLGRTAFHTPLLKNLISEVKRFRPNVIHVFKPKGFAGAAASFWLFNGIRSLVLDCDDWEGRGGWSDVKPYPWLVKEYIDRQERSLIRNAPVVTVASRALEKRASELRGSSNSVVYIPNCGPSRAQKEAQRLARTASPSEIRDRLALPDGPIILYTGHFEPAEDLPFFCRCAATAASKTGASVVFAGNNADRVRLQEFFAAYSNVRVFFFPQLPYDEFLLLVRACDVAAFPYPDDAIHRAKCSARIVDYMAMGTPVVTSAVGQNCEYIVDGESGMLARPGDEGDFTGKLERLLHDPDLRETLGRNAQRRIEQKFHWGGQPLQQCLAAYSRVTGVPARSLDRDVDHRKAA
jgi:glycosyltransferase involved in cell wall biosynthesis